MNRESDIMSRAHKLANEFVKARIDMVVNEVLECISDNPNDRGLDKMEITKIIGKDMALTYALGYRDGDAGETLKTLYI
jgi:hypothetical protein